MRGQDHWPARPHSPRSAHHFSGGGNEDAPSLRSGDRGVDGEYITVARVARPQGRRGEVAAELLTDFPERFTAGKRVFALDQTGGRRELQIEEAWGHKGRVVLKFAGVDDISAAAALAACEIQVPRSERVSLEDEDAVYVSELVGCVVFEVSGTETREIGSIADVQFGAGEAPLLIVKAAGREHMIPFAAEYLKGMDLDARRLELSLPEGMLALDAPLTQEEKARQHRG